jgi:hypothetical protein
MPKSRRRKKKAPSGVVQMTPEVHAALLEQLEAFRKKFGRDPGPGDPVIFDPQEDVPVPISPDAGDVEAEVLAAMQKVDLPPHFAYAYKKTGLIGVEGLIAKWPADRRREWANAVKEYFLIEEASKKPDRPDPQDWSTTIPELLMSPFSKRDLNQVFECLHAIAPIEAQGMKVVTQIELAATLLASACEHGYISGEETGEGTDGPSIYALTEQLVLKRAREIYAQGRI